jgi:hypothetical protein
MTRRRISPACGRVRASIDRGVRRRQEQQMSDDFLDCPSCGSKREFRQVHARVTRCPDSGDGCPEWYCTACGAALLIRLPPALRWTGRCVRAPRCPATRPRGGGFVSPLRPAVPKRTSTARPICVPRDGPRLQAGVTAQLLRGRTKLDGEPPPRRLAPRRRPLPRRIGSRERSDPAGSCCCTTRRAGRLGGHSVIATCGAESSEVAVVAHRAGRLELAHRSARVAVG